MNYDIFKILNRDTGEEIIYIALSMDEHNSKSFPVDESNPDYIAFIEANPDALAEINSSK